MDSGNKWNGNGIQASPDDLNLNKCTINDKELARTSKDDQNQNRVNIDNNIWTSGALFTLHSFGSEDKPIESDEWVDFLQKTMKVSFCLGLLE